MVDRFRRHICVILSAIRTGPPSDRRRLIMQAAQGTANILVTQFCNPSTPPDTWAWDALESNFLSCVLTDELTGEFTSLTPIQAAVRESLTGGGSRGLQLDADRGAPFGVPRQCVIEALCAGRPVPVAVEPEGRVWMHMCPWYTPTIRNQVCGGVAVFAVRHGGVAVGNMWVYVYTAYRLLCPHLCALVYIHCCSICTYTYIVCVHTYSHIYSHLCIPMHHTGASYPVHP